MLFRSSCSALVLVQLASHVRTSTFSVLCFGCMGCLQLGFGCLNLDRPAIWRIPSLAVDRAHGHHMRIVWYFCASLSLSLSGWLGCGWGVIWVAGWVVCKSDQHFRGYQGFAVYPAHDHNMRPVSYFCTFSFLLVGLWLGGWVDGAAGNRKHLSSGFCTSHENFISLRRCIFDAYA